MLSKIVMEAVVLPETEVVDDFAVNKPVADPAPRSCGSEAVEAVHQGARVPKEKAKEEPKKSQRKIAFCFIAFVCEHKIALSIYLSSF